MLHRDMSQQERGSAVNISFSAPQIRYPFPALPLRLNVDRVIRPLARSFRRVTSPGQYAFSLWLFSCRCDSSYWDGRRPAGFLKGGSPALCSRAEPGPCVCDAQGSESQGDETHIYLQICPFQIGIHYYWGSAVSGAAAGDSACFCAACCVSFFAAFFAACC